MSLDLDIMRQYRHSIGIKDDWGIQSYKNPRHYQDPVQLMNLKKQNQNRSISFASLVSKFPHKKSYFQTIEKQSKNIPGPGQYKDTQLFPKIKKSISNDKIILKSESKSYLTELLKHKSKIPGIGNYNIDKGKKNIKKSPDRKKIAQDQVNLEKLLNQKLEDDYKLKIGPGRYNIHDKQIGKQAIKIGISPQRKVLPKLQESRKKPNINTYTPLVCYDTFEKLMKNKSTISSSKLGKQKKFYNPQERAIGLKPGPAQYKMNTNWDQKHVLQSISKGKSNSVYH